jgi:NAD(P)-dependent dehydrogenase (short-subunit alcohol dehydrogenase family)
LIELVRGLVVVVDFENKSVIVTGAGAGMGEAAALEYGRSGASVLVADIDQTAAQRVVDAIRSEGGTAEAHAFDLRKRAEVEGVVRAAVEHFGGIDVLAIVGAIYPNSRVDEMSEEFWDNLFGVDLKGPLFAIQAALPHLKERHGNIVTVASGAAFYAIPGLAAYSAAKAGLVALGRVVALESSPQIRVNAVVPGPTMTAGVRAGAAARAARDQENKDSAAPVTPSSNASTIGRWLDPAEIADVIVWVSSDKAGAVNGAILRVDAGHVML